MKMCACPHTHSLRLNNAYSEFLRSNFGFSPRTACWPLRSKCSVRSRSSEKNSLWVCWEQLLVFFQSTFPWHRLCNIDHRTFSFFTFSVLRRIPAAYFLCFLKNKSPWDTSKTVFKHWKHRTIQCSRVWFSRSQRCCGSDRWWYSCLHLQRWPCQTLWTHNLWWRRTWSGSQTRAEVRLARAFKLGKVRQDGADGTSWKWSRSDRAGTAKTKGGETWERRKQDGDKHLSMVLSHARVFTHVRRQNVRALCAENVRATNECVQSGHPLPSLSVHRCTVGVLARPTSVPQTLRQIANPCCVLVSWRRACLALVFVHHAHLHLRILKCSVLFGDIRSWCGQIRLSCSESSDSSAVSGFSEFY